jgi:hypothetical protein
VRISSSSSPFNFSFISFSWLRFEYKKYGEDWSHAKSVNINKGSSEVKIVDLTDLDPGTPYFVRLVIQLENDLDGSSAEYGPECVFDTKPIDCTPKKNTCAIQ